MWIRPNLTVEDVQVLQCPTATCAGRLKYRGTLGGAVEEGSGKEDQRVLEWGTLDCRDCGTSWPVRFGCPNFIAPGSITGLDRLLQPIYDYIAPTHDLGVNFVLPVLQYPDADGSRDRYIERMELDKLVPDKGKIRILEVGIGAGANLPLLLDHLPFDLDVEFWGVDFSKGMLLQCVLRSELWYGLRGVKLLLGDAHRLPFGDAQFDRVFHVGAINGYHDPAAALREMARVARRDTPIIVVDEGLDPNRKHSLRHRIAFDALTWFDNITHAPKNLVPKECAASVHVTAVSRFYYCMTFRTPR